MTVRFALLLAKLAVRRYRVFVARGAQFGYLSATIDLTDLRVPEAWRADIEDMLEEEPFEYDRLTDGIFCQHADAIQRFVADLDANEFEEMAAVRGLHLSEWRNRRLTISFPLNFFLLFIEAVLKDDAKCCPKCGRRKISFIHWHDEVHQRAIYRGCPVHDNHCEHCPPPTEDEDEFAEW